jgi:hypothetical protein
LTTDLIVEKGGTRVAFIAEQVPEGISHEEHLNGMESSLQNLEKFLAKNAR